MKTKKKTIKQEKPICINGISPNLCSHIQGTDCKCKRYEQSIKNANKQ